MLLVPYDSDYDQRPCKKKGHKSHWCIISGIATFIPHSKLSNVKNIDQLNMRGNNNHEHEPLESVSNDGQYLQLVDDSSNIVIISKSQMSPKMHSQISNMLKNEIFSDKEKRKDRVSMEDEPSFYLIARQSKSKRTFLFDPVQLAKSNRNLVEVDPDQFMVQNGASDDEIFNKYVIPSGGLKHGLANQVIVLKILV